MKSLTRGPRPNGGVGTITSMLPESVRAAVTAGRLCHLVTVNNDGSPQVTCVWVGVDGDDLVTAHLGAYQKVKNVRGQPRVALSIETDHTGPSGMTDYLVVYGCARVVEGGAADLLQRLAPVYVGPCEVSSNGQSTARSMCCALHQSKSAVTVHC